MKKEDLRIIKTKQAIKDSFIELVEVKGYNRVSVTDIVKKANINRNTFYLHYEDKDDLIKKLVAETTEKMGAALGATQFLRNASLSDIKEFQIRWGFRNLLRMVIPEQEFLRVILMDESLNGYFDRMYYVVKKNLSDKLNVKNPRSNLIFEYTVSGMMGLVKQWILYSPTSPAETAKILAQLAYTNLQQFKDIN